MVSSNRSSDGLSSKFLLAFSLIISASFEVGTLAIVAVSSERSGSLSILDVSILVSELRAIAAKISSSSISSKSLSNSLSSRYSVSCTLSSSLIMLTWCFSDLRGALNPEFLHNATKVDDLLKWMNEVHDVLCLLGYRLLYEVQGERIVELYNISTPLPSYEELALKIEGLAEQGFQLLRDK